MKTKTEKLNAINGAYFRVARCCESSRHWEQYVQLNRDEEKSHRRFCPDHVQCGLTAGQATKLFAVKELFEIITGDQFKPTAEDYFFIRKSIYASWALFKECGERLAAEFPIAECKEWLAAIDYAELNKDPRQLQAA